MKALEKAAKDRGEAPAEPAAAANAAAAASNTPKPELSLEPLAAETPTLQPARTEPQPKPAPEAAASLSRQQAKAASIMFASRRDRDGFGAYLRTHPLILMGAAAGIFLLGFGIYVYLQITSPGLFVRQPPPVPTVPPPLAQAPTAPAAPQPLTTAQLIQPAPEPAPLQPGVTPLPQPKPAAAVPSPPPETPRHTIFVSRGSAVAAVPPVLTEAYAALEAHRLDQAQRLYHQLLLAEPKNIDALLGLAAIATQEGKTDEAAGHYVRILELDPRHALAQSGLIAILGRADPLAAETRLKQLIAREPSPFLYFTLGNLYADQSLWAQAQQAYFQAYHLEPANPDYAYNLAVGLEHLGQSRPALDFYRRAVQLASAKRHANFSLPQARERITRLAARVE